MAGHPHRRLNPLTGEWVLVSPHRTRRPWRGQVEKSAIETLPRYDPDCYLCPGNQRASDTRNPEYKDTYVFENDFSALLPESPELNAESRPLFESQAVGGTCRVICFSPRHDLTLPLMSQAEIRAVVDLWVQQSSELGKRYPWIQIFENKGAMMGSSNPHPHGQIWASNRIPNEPAKEDLNQRSYFQEHSRPMLVAYAEEESSEGIRTVVENDHWQAVVPFWALWPFETLLIPRRHVLRLPDLTEDEMRGLAQIMKMLLIRYDNLFEVSFPYSMGWHGAPFAQGDFEHWQLHAHFYPPLLRSATVKKFMVGYEMMAEAQRDLTPEDGSPTYAGLGQPLLRNGLSELQLKYYLDYPKSQDCL